MAAVQVASARAILLFSSFWRGDEHHTYPTGDPRSSIWNQCHFARAGKPGCCGQWPCFAFQTARLDWKAGRKTSDTSNLQHHCCTDLWSRSASLNLNSLVSVTSNNCAGWLFLAVFVSASGFSACYLSRVFSWGVRADQWTKKMTTMWWYRYIIYSFI